jgi:hypothetical protein
MAEEQTTLCPKEKIPKEFSESVYGRRTDNTMAKRTYTDSEYSFCTFSFGHSVVCSSAIYGF